ncbi:CapA family protein [Bacteroidota bacterium]
MKPIKLAITGDLSITGSFEKKVRNNEEIFSNEIRNVLNKVDYCICNLEGPVTNKPNYLNPKIKVSSPPNSISYLAQRNIKIFNLANNHILDCGEEGFVDTITELKKNKCLYFGAWLKDDDINNSIVIENESDVKLTSFTEKLNHNKNLLGISTSKYLNTRNNRKLNWDILFHHGGEEYSLYPSPTKRNYLKIIQKRIDSDFIISHHSHTLQGLEKIGKTNIFYSLGNFVFDIPPHLHYHFTDESAILILTLDKNSWTHELIPIKIDRENGIVELGTNNIIERFNKISDFKDYNKKWRKDAYRTLIERIPEINEENKHPLHKKNGFALLFDIKFYKKALKVLFDSNNRSIYLNAFIYKMFYRKSK